MIESCGTILLIFSSEILTNTPQLVLELLLIRNWKVRSYSVEIQFGFIFECIEAFFGAPGIISLKEAVPHY